MNDFVVVVLLNYNQNEYTVKCIESILDSDYENFKIVLVDNGSTEDSARELEGMLPDEERLVYKRLVDNIGYARGTNYGLEEGFKLNPDFFLIMNNDTILDKNAIREMVKTCKKHDEKVLVTGKVYDFVEPNKFQQVGAELINKRILRYRKLGFNEEDTGQFEKEELRDMIDDVFVLHPISLYKKLKGYSAYFWVNGANADSALRAMKHGYKLMYTPKAKLWHKGSASIGGRDLNPKLAFWSIQSTLMLRYLHLSSFNFFLFYLRTIENVSRAYLKSIYFKLFKGKDSIEHAKAKIKGLTHFNKWVFNKVENDGYNPY